MVRRARPIATRGLGESWDICTDMAIKLVPGGHPYHVIAEAAANASREANVAAADVASITIARPGMTKLTGPLHPTDLIDMAHSPAYFAAAGVADRAFSWGPCQCGEDRGSGDPRADRPRASWRAAHRGCRTLSTGRDGHHCARMTGGVFRTRSTRRRARRHLGSIVATWMRSIARWYRWRGWADARSRPVSRSSTISGGSRMWWRFHGRCERASALNRATPCHCEERSHAAISIAVHNVTEIAASLRSSQ